HGTGSGSSLRRQDTILGDRPAQTRFERLSKQSNDPPLSRVNTLRSGEDSMKLNELIEICTKLSKRVLALENIKTTQDLEITNLNKRLKKLEKKKKSRTLQLKRRLFKFMIESSAKKSLGDQEDASKQGKNEIDQDEWISWFQEDAKTQRRCGVSVTTASSNTASTSITTASINITTVEPVTTASVPITTAGVSVSTVEPSTPPTTTTIIEDKDLTIAQTLMKIRNYELAQRLQAEEQGELTIEERSKLFVELMDKRNNTLQSLELKRSKENHQPKPKREIKYVDSFIPMDLEVVEGSKSQSEGSKKRTREEHESDNSKKQKIDENVEAQVDDEAEIKKHMKIVVDEEEIAVDAIPLATKPPVIIDWKIIKKRKDNINREDLETLWKLVKAKHGNTMPEEAYERVLWGDLKVMFEPDVESEVWRNLQGYNVTVWKLFSSSGVHFVRFQNLH
ncbi:hypothetical protein Tco_1472958, partial [Tanacetum coccineum]